MKKENTVEYKINTVKYCLIATIFISNLLFVIHINKLNNKIDKLEDKIENKIEYRYEEIRFNK